MVGMKFYVLNRLEVVTSKEMGWYRRRFFFLVEIKGSIVLGSLYKESK